MKLFLPLLCCILTMTVAAEEKTEKSFSLKPGNWDSVKALIKQSKGKVVVVDIWSTACLPCMQEFPNLLKLKEQYKDRIVCVSFNIDYAGIKSKPPEAYRERVEKFLKRQKSGAKHFLSTTPSDELYDELKLNSIPAVYVFGTNGTLKKRFDDSLFEDGDEEAFTYKEDITPFISELLK